MRYAMVTFLVMTSTVTMVAVAQDGNGRGPPQSIIVAQPTPTPTTILQGVVLPKLLQPKLELPTGLPPKTK